MDLSWFFVKNWVQTPPTPLGRFVSRADQKERSQFRFLQLDGSPRGNSWRWPGVTFIYPSKLYVKRGLCIITIVVIMWYGFEVCLHRSDSKQTASGTSEACCSSGVWNFSALQTRPHLEQTQLLRYEMTRKAVCRKQAWLRKTVHRDSI